MWLLFRARIKGPRPWGINANDTFQKIHGAVFLCFVLVRLLRFFSVYFNIFMLLLWLYCRIPSGGVTKLSFRRIDSITEKVITPMFCVYGIDCANMPKYTYLYASNVPSISFAPLNSCRIWTISQFVFNGNSCPVRLMKYFHLLRLSSSLIHVISDWITENSPHFTLCRILGMNTLGRQFAIRWRMLNVAFWIWKVETVWKPAAWIDEVFL